MKVMILAAGRGQRMRHLSDSRPKPLLEVQGKPLIEHHIARLAEAGFKELVINVSYKADQIINTIGFGKRWGIDIQYSCESQQKLETAGGIRQALPLLGERFVVVNADVYTQFPFETLEDINLDGLLAHLVLVPNPEHHLVGDFGYDGQLIYHKGDCCDQSTYTFSGIGLYNHSLFEGLKSGQVIGLSKVLNAAIDRKQVSGQLYQSDWHDVGTPERLKRLNDA